MEKVCDPLHREGTLRAREERGLASHSGPTQGLIISEGNGSPHYEWGLPKPWGPIQGCPRHAFPEQGPWWEGRPHGRCTSLAHLMGLTTCMLMNGAALVLTERASCASWELEFGSRLCSSPCDIAPLCLSFLVCKISHWFRSVLLNDKHFRFLGEAVKPQGTQDSPWI